MRRLLGLGALIVLLAVPGTGTLRAQTHGGGEGPPPSPYVGHQTSPVRGLSMEEIHALRTGEGMGLARAAELNGYPGPRHVLELADGLALSDEQRATVQGLFAQMQAEAIAAGEALLAQHAALELAFRSHGITPATLAQHTGELGRLEGELRAVHLKYHLLTAPLLSPEQTAAYARLRGYGDAAPAQHGPGQGHH